MPARGDFEEGCRLFAAGRLDETAALFRGLLRQQPDEPDLLNALATVLDAQNHRAEALDCLRRACDLRPGFGPYRYNLANVLRRSGDLPGAEQQYLEAVNCAPELAEAYHGLGSLYLDDGRLEMAEACLRRAVQLNPRLAPALHDLGRLCQQQGKVEEAEQCYRRCLTVAPRFLPALNELGMLLLRGNRLDEAQNCFEQALKVDPGYLQARCNLAVLATWQGRLEHAIEELSALSSLAPFDGDIHFNLSLALLAAGRMDEGWREHEWRFRKALPVPVLHGGIPRWQGEPLDGRIILLHAEQGYGDSLQFVRYASLLAARGATVVVEGQDRIITPLLGTVSGVVASFYRGEEVPIKPDYQVPMMSVALGLGASAWPPPVLPYLHPPADRVGSWRDRLSELSGLKVGVAWAGRPEHENDANRSIPPELFAPFRTLNGISWVGLQFGPHRTSPLPFSVFEATDKVGDFCDSAALVAGLDLVITIDSAIAHLAGGLGVPVWLLLPWNPDWRWMHGRTDSLWYPSMRIYRQTMPGQWQKVIDKVTYELSAHRDIL